MQHLWKHDGTNDFGGPDTYRMAAGWLDCCDEVEDWGCGMATAKPYFKKARYRGIDGSGDCCDELVDLREYGSTTQGILMRHVLEHNLEWRLVLANAIRSFSHRMALILFVTPGDSEVILSSVPGQQGTGRILTLQLLRVDFMFMISRFIKHTEQPGHEWVYLMER